MKMKKNFEVRVVMPLAAVERLYLEHVVVELGNNKSKAAKLLKLDRRTHYRRLNGEVFRRIGLPRAD